MQSRYYNPEIGRFINADGVTSTGQGLLGNNMFAYCLNNPVNAYDPNGMCSYSVYYGGKVPDGSCYRCAQQTTKNRVPLYDQDDTRLCWAYCQTMIESFQNGEKLSSQNADKRAKQLAIAQNGEENWNRGTWPTNLGERQTIGTIHDLFNAVSSNGPVYAYYANNSGNTS